MNNLCRAPDHEPIQGKQYPDAEYEALNNSLVRRIGTLNCGHSAYPIIMGISSPQYTPEQLEAMREANEKGITYNGKHYTGYEATQHQRALERAIRKQKRRILIDETTGDAEKLETDQIKLQMLRQEYKRFSKAAGLRTQTERAEVAGFGHKQASAADKAYRNYQSTLEKSTKSGIIKTVNIGRSVGASAKNYPVKLVESKQHVKLAEGQQIKGKVFAGKGTKVAIKDRFRLEADYKIAADKWQKVSGNAYIILKGKKQKAELHWYEADGEIFEMKAKRYIDES